MKGVTVLFLSFAFLGLLSVVYGVQPRQASCTTYGTITACFTQSPTTWTTAVNITVTQSIPPSEQPTVTTTQLILIVVVVAALFLGLGYILNERKKKPA